jgi:hypothetical protein
MELALFLPWIVFLFVGAFDWGFYAWALVSTESAARVAALYTSTSAGTAADATGACNYALAELAYAPNIAGYTWVSSSDYQHRQTSGSGRVTTCAGVPVLVTAVSTTGPDGAAASQVSVTYQTPLLIPIPGLLPAQISITRTAQMRVRGL